MLQICNANFSNSVPESNGIGCFAVRLYADRDWESGNGYWLILESRKIGEGRKRDLEEEDFNQSTEWI